MAETALRYPEAKPHHSGPRGEPAAAREEVLSMNPVSTLIIADDHPLFRVALRLGVRTLEPGAHVVEVDSFDSLKRAVADDPDAGLVLLDLMMPGAEGLSSLQYLRTQAPELRVAVVSALGQKSWALSARALGAVGFVHKSATPEQMQEILRQLLDGGIWWPEASPDEASADTPENKLDRLSRQELRVLLHLKEGRLNKQIADELSISESTVKAHISTILNKLGLHSRTQAAVLAERLLSSTAPG